MKPLNIFKSSFPVSVKLILEAQTVGVVQQKLREEADITIFSSGFEKNRIECHNAFSWSAFLRVSASVLKKHISETMDDRSIQRSHKHRKSSLAKNGGAGTKSCQTI